MPVAFSITLLRFLESLAESIVPVSLHSRCLEMNDRDEAFEVCLFNCYLVTDTWTLFHVSSPNASCSIRFRHPRWMCVKFSPAFCVTYFADAFSRSGYQSLHTCTSYVSYPKTKVLLNELVCRIFIDFKKLSSYIILHCSNNTRTSSHAWRSVVSDASYIPQG